MNSAAEKRGFRKYLVYLVGALSLMYYMGFYNYGLNLSDEGYLVYGAKRVLSGQIPGVDFHAYMPGRYLVLALLFDLFGESILVERSLWVVIRTIIAMVFFRLSNRLVPSMVALAPTLFIVLIPGPWHKSFELLFPLLWLFSIHACCTNPTYKSILIVGIAGGITLFFRLETGLLILCLSIMTIAMSRQRRSPTGIEERRFTSQFPRNQFLKDTIIFACGPLLVFLPYLCFLWYRSAILESLGFYFHELAAGLGGSNPFLLSLPSIFLRAISTDARDPIDPLPVFWLFFLLIYLVMYGRLTVILLRRKWTNDMTFIFVLTLYGTAQFYQALFQPDLSHLLQAGPFAYLLLSLILYRGYQRVCAANSIDSSNRYSRNTCAMLFWGGALALSVSFATVILTNEKDFYFTGSFRVRNHDMIILNLERANVFVEPEAAAEIEAIVSHIQSNSRREDGLTTLIYFPMFNFMADRENPLFYDIFFPHTVGSMENQQRIVENMKSRMPKFIVVTSGLLASPEADLSEERFKAYGRILLAFLNDHYQVVRQHEIFALLEKST